MWRRLGFRKMFHFSYQCPWLSNTEHQKHIQTKIGLWERQQSRLWKHQKTVSYPTPLQHLWEAAKRWKHPCCQLGHLFKLLPARSVWGGRHLSYAFTCCRKHSCWCLAGQTLLRIRMRQALWHWMTAYGTPSFQGAVDMWLGSLTVVDSVNDPWKVTP